MHNILSDLENNDDLYFVYSESDMAPNAEEDLLVTMPRGLHSGKVITKCFHPFPDFEFPREVPF
jgi:hypothetical protein